MPGKIQSFLARATTDAAAELVAALDRIPAEKRCWQPADIARSALDQFAECALLNGNTADLIYQRAGKPLAYAQEYGRIKDGLVADEPAARALLTENTARAVTAILGVPEEALEETIPLPWGPMPMPELLAYPYWNMVYHLGQINYIAAFLGDM